MFFVLPIHADLREDIARFAITEGYNTNTYQAQDNANVPVLSRHPSPFTGIEGDVETRIATNSTDLYTLRLNGRLMHYEPLQTENQSDDAAVNAALSARWSLSARTFVAVTADGHVATLNGAHLSDTTILDFDPTIFRRTYWLDSEEISLTHELSPTWRVAPAVGVITSGTIYQAPTTLPGGGETEHRGLDYVTPYVRADIDKVVSDRLSFDALAIYMYSYDLYVLDLTQNPPRNIGPDKMAFLTLLPGFTYHFTQEWSNTLHVGGVLSSAPPRDIDQRPIISPAGNDVLTYTREFWSMIASVGYTYGTVNPRLGAGPGGNASVVVVGTPSRIGKWKNFSLLINGQASYSQLVTGATAAGGTSSTTLGLVALDAELRYALSPWFGLLGGYQARYATYNTPGEFLPPFSQSIIFVGLSGYWSTNRDIPALTTFVAPVKPPS